MSERTVSHGTFAIEREFPYAPARVFAAWGDPKAKAQWFAAPAHLAKEVAREQDFRVGGKERLRGEWNDGRTSDFHAVYQDILPDRRIVYSYNMYVNDRKISVSLATIEFEPARVDGKPGTRLILTEQGAYLDSGKDGQASREQGTRALIDNLERALRGA
ncbi:MAG TPA: SRPBCC family protein [Burkholderiales bacterium]|nr:SRPBCC family protein [Burkholderiales bacterium]